MESSGLDEWWWKGDGQTLDAEGGGDDEDWEGERGLGDVEYSYSSSSSALRYEVRCEIKGGVGVRSCLMDIDEDVDGEGFDDGEEGAEDSDELDVDS